MLDRAPDRRDVDRLAVQRHLAGNSRAPGTAEDAHGEFRAARSHQPGDADHLASAHIDVDVLDRHAIGVNRVMHDPVVHLEDDLADLGMARREAVVDRTADHRGDDATLADVGLFERLDGAAVAQHRDTVGDLADLVQLVRDQDRGDALLAEFDQEVEQRVAVLLRQRGGRFVEDQQLDLLGQRLGDLDQLLLADADIGDQRVGVFPEPDLAQQLAGAPPREVPVDHAEARLLVAEEDVLGDRQQRHQRQFLVDDDDADALGIVDAGKTAFLAEEADRALVAAMRIDARQHLHERRLAGAVLADDGVYFAGAHIQVDVLQRLHAGKRLGDVAHFKNDVVHRRTFG